MKIPGKERAGFTLIELLVATAVLVLLLALLTTFFGGISSAWLHAQEKMDNFAKGRTLLGAIERDLRNAVIRQDLPAFPSTNVSNAPALAFFVRSFGQETDAGNLRPLTYVTYFRGTNDVITRRDQAFDFDTQISAWDPFGTNSPLPPSGGMSGFEREICQGILAFRFVYLQSDGSTSDTFVGVPLKTSDPTQFDEAKPRTVAVRLSIAVVSEQAQAVLRKLGKEADLASLFQARIPASGTSAKAAWDALISDDPALSALALPSKVLAGIRTYEKVTTLESGAAFTTQ